MPYYAEAEEWSDIEPIPLDEGGPNALAAITYSDEYDEAMSYLRAVMAKNEMSERALALTEDIIASNPAHYTVWLYRAKIVLSLEKDLHEELAWLNAAALRNLKNYQIWHHRQTIVDTLGDVTGEQAFVARMLAKDAKNYHVWSYRQWLVRRFGLWAEDSGELEAVEALLREDVRNNSAWNHRWFLVFGSDAENLSQKKILDREMDYAKAAVELAPQNPSPWNYLRGIVRYAKLPLSTLKDFAEQYASIEKPDEVSSSHALDLLADIYSEESSKENAAKALDLLAQRYDPIRENYWNYRKSLLDQPKVVA
ncbi:Protein farnesyltransferase/geranylgeranyltransferase type-1 subunit alpha [Lasiodiplodia theobromae]|uniref:Protein farnesyltransferase/geranylgeranyltransferase type-1 subunit alpha n=1 Tax=Lasiodiplodia theobromae TaxID=45133 RepID=A0A5N5CTX9_9PEZI|nr:Protein farnesyltransferase/geranylgeranyltransferase type-1 subunit alpha [Lasiodiplodia theobromae]